jgi:NADH-quinone oxidoreductase subunit I
VQLKLLPKHKASARPAFKPKMKVESSESKPITDETSTEDTPKPVARPAFKPKMKVAPSTETSVENTIEVTDENATTAADEIKPAARPAFRPKFKPATARDEVSEPVVEASTEVAPEVVELAEESKLLVQLDQNSSQQLSQ